MSSLPYSFTAAFLIAALVFGTTSADIANPLFHFCFNPENFTSGSTYEANLNKLTAYLYQNLPATGFGSDSVGKYPNQVYGLSLCRGDVSSSDCRACIADARDEIPEICPNNQGAIVWYDNCFLKFDEADFIGRIDSSNKFYLYNVNSVTDPAVFNKKTRELLTKLAEQAYVVPNLFAAGEGEAKGYMSPTKKKAVLYGWYSARGIFRRAIARNTLMRLSGSSRTAATGRKDGEFLAGVVTLDTRFIHASPLIESY